MAGYNTSSAYDFSLFEPQVAVSPAKKQNSRNRTDAKGRSVSAQRTAGSSSRTNNRSAVRGDVRKNAPATARPRTNGNAAIKTYEKTAKTVNGFQQYVDRNSKAGTVPAVAKKIMAYGLVCFCLVTCLLFVRAQSDKVASQIADVKNKIDIAEGETVRLNAELNSKISTEKIEDYAENVLGMVKAESYQITYLDLSDGNEVVVSGNKSLNKGDGKSSGLKELFAYIF